jgi:hypothetical protein
MGQRHKRWQRILFALLIANFAAMGAHDAWFGGDALSGHVKDGYFLVGFKDRFTEVSEAAFNASHLHGVLFWIATVTLMFILFFVILDEISRSK